MSQLLSDPGPQTPDPGRPCADLAPLDAILARYPHEEAALIQVLQDVQRAYRYLPCDVLAQVSRTLGVPLAKVFSVATFYKAFSLTAQGRVVVKVCMGTACHIRGADQLVDELQKRLAVKPGETTGDGDFTLLTVNCVGACAMAPLVLVGDRYLGGAKAAGLAPVLDEARARVHADDAKEAGDAH